MTAWRVSLLLIAIQATSKPCLHGFSEKYTVIPWRNGCLANLSARPSTVRGLTFSNMCFLVYQASDYEVYLGYKCVF